MNFEQRSLEYHDKLMRYLNNYGGHKPANLQRLVELRRDWIDDVIELPEARRFWTYDDIHLEKADELSMLCQTYRNLEMFDEAEHALEEARNMLNQEAYIKSNAEYKEDSMIQANFSLAESQIHFLEQYKDYGFEDKSALVRAALTHLQQELARENLQKSADLYAEVYEEDEEVRELTETALVGWPT